MIARLARAAALGVVLAAALLATLSGLLFSRPLPTIDGHYRLLGLHERAEVLRDEMGVPHIFARDRHDLFFLQGYVTAQDRLAQMEALRGAARAAVGSAARSAVDRASPALLEALDAYAAGVTKLIGQHAAARALPPELVLAGARPAAWEPADTLAIVAAYLERLLPASVCGSAAAARTLKGRPVMAADLYLAAPDPGWYEIGLEGGGIRAVGVSLPGVPAVAAGHNGAVAWAVLSSAHPASDPAATLGNLLSALPAPSALAFAEAVRGSAAAACVADVEGRVGGIDRDLVAFVPAERPAVLGGEGSRAAALAERLGGARHVDVEAMRVVLGRPPAAIAGARVIVDLAEVDRSAVALSRGASGLRGSPHYGDQAALWEIGAVHRLPLSRSAIARLEGELVLRAR